MLNCCNHARTASLGSPAAWPTKKNMLAECSLQCHVQTSTLATFLPQLAWSIQSDCQLPCNFEHGTATASF